MIGFPHLALLYTLVCISCASSEDEWHQTLLKRQAPGTPSYDCHLSCGTAITLSRGSDPCTNSTFLDDYKACIGCAGPDDQNVWQYYGGTLTNVGTKCGLPTTPVSGGPSSSSGTASASVNSSSTATAVSSTVSSITTPSSSVQSTSPTSASSSSAANASASATSAVTTGAGSIIRTSLAGSLVVLVAAIMNEVL